jgi:hypothetical protein
MPNDDAKVRLFVFFHSIINRLDPKKIVLEEKKKCEVYDNVPPGERNDPVVVFGLHDHQFIADAPRWAIRDAYREVRGAGAEVDIGYNGDEFHFYYDGSMTDFVKAFDWDRFEEATVKRFKSLDSHDYYKDPDFGEQIFELAQRVKGKIKRALGRDDSSGSQQRGGR